MSTSNHHATNFCEVCKRHLTSPESVARHRGTACHIVWLEKRISALELNQDIMKAAISALIGREK